MAVRVDPDRCMCCGTCEETCPVGAIRLQNGLAVVDEALCRECGACIEECPQGALKLPRQTVSQPQTGW